MKAFLKALFSLNVIVWLKLTKDTQVKVTLIDR